jgi:hypothetical protein
MRPAFSISHHIGDTGPAASRSLVREWLRLSKPCHDVDARNDLTLARRLRTLRDDIPARWRALVRNSPRG